MHRPPSTFPVVLAGFTAFLDLYATQPLLPLLMRVFQASHFAVSLTVTASTVGVAIAAPVVGRVADLIGRKRVIIGSAFVVTAALVFVLTVAGSPIGLGVFQGWAPEWLIHGVAQASFLGHFSAITRGVIDLRDVIYFLSIMIAFLAANTILIDLEKAE